MRLDSYIQSRHQLQKLKEHNPSDIPLVSAEERTKMVVIFHNETTFNANECQRTQWGREGEYMIMPKSKGSGIMVSDFIDRMGT